MIYFNHFYKGQIHIGTDKNFPLTVFALPAEKEFYLFDWMKNTKKKLKGQSKVVNYSFTGSNIIKYSGLNTVAKYMNKQGIIKSASTLFQTQWHGATKFGVNQLLISIIMASFCGKRNKPNLQNFIIYR